MFALFLKKLQGFCSRGHRGRPLVGCLTYFKKGPPEARSYWTPYLITLLDTSKAPHPTQTLWTETQTMDRDYLGLNLASAWLRSLEV